MYDWFYTHGRQCQAEPWGLYSVRPRNMLCVSHDTGGFNVVPVVGALAGAC